MPPLPDVPAVARIGWHQQIGEDAKAVNRIYVGYSGGTASEAFITALANTAAAAWANHLEPSLGTFHTLLFTQATDLSSDVGATFTNVVTATGTDAGDPLAAGTAMRFKWQVIRRWRGGHPGMYLSGLVEDRLADAQTWSLATVNEFGADWTQVESAILSMGVVGGNAPTGIVSVSYYNGFDVVISPTTGRARNVPKLRVGGPRVDQLTNFEIDTHVSSQRRRNLIRS